ncbi:hypothetical protein KM043_001895 [Ampulex compressa]|nr:hypothetical protein KM043_001895 [Ampulex compressa]
MPVALIIGLLSPLLTDLDLTLSATLSHSTDSKELFLLLLLLLDLAPFLLLVAFLPTRGLSLSRGTSVSMTVVITCSFSSKLLSRYFFLGTLETLSLPSTEVLSSAVS